MNDSLTRIATLSHLRMRARTFVEVFLAKRKSKTLVWGSTGICSEPGIHRY